MIPQNRIKTYTGGVNDYTLDNKALSIHIKDVLNDVGTFNFVLPTVEDTGYLYTDIAINDKAYFYLWDAEVGSLPANPQFIGKICRISAPLTCGSGYYRVFEGKLLGEILGRQLKRNKSWIATDADVIVAELASDLGLGTVFSGDASDDYDVTLHVDVEPFMDVLQKVSDYWVSAGVEIRKDWYVNISNNLVWKTRPLRSVGVETLTVGVNILNYNVLRDVEPVKNYITVFGTNGTNAQEGRCEPVGHDEWTYGAGWDPDYGTEGPSVVTKILGANSLLLSSEDVAGHETIQCHYDFSASLQGMGRSGYQLLKFYICRDITGAAPITGQVRLCTDATNYFYRNIVTEASNLNFNAVNSDLGDSQEYDVVLNPNGVWHKALSPDWFNINFIEFYFERTDANDMFFYIDALYFSKGRYRANASSGAPASEQSDFDVVDDNLKSDAECQSRAETLLYQLKDAPIRIDIETMGNMNILIGDQLSVTIPAESITAQPYDVLSVEHDLTKEGFKTKASMVNSSVTPTLINIRQLPSGTPYEVIAKKFGVQREIGRGLQIIK